MRPGSRVVGGGSSSRWRSLLRQSVFTRIAGVQTAQLEGPGPQASSFEAIRKSLPANDPRKSMNLRRTTRATRVRSRSGVQVEGG